MSRQIVQRAVDNGANAAAQANHDGDSHSRVNEIFETGLLNEGREGAKQNLDFVVTKLRQYPSLARIRYGKIELQRINLNRTQFPFFHLLECGAEITILKEIYAMNPAALKQDVFIPLSSGRRGALIMNVMHVALYFRSHDTELIRFLLSGVLEENSLKQCIVVATPRNQRLPNISSHDYVHLMPIHVALRRHAPKAIIEALLQESPTQARYSERIHGRDCYTTACLTYSEEEGVPDLILSYIRAGRGEHESFVMRNKNAIQLYDQNNARAMEKLLDNFSKFTYCLDDPGTGFANQRGLQELFRLVNLKSRATSPLRKLCLSFMESTDIGCL